MKYNNVEFDAIVATPACGKSYLCDKYPDLFVDVDEERLRCKYYVPENITREELESTKGIRPFERRYKGKEWLDMLYAKLDQYVKQGKTLILAPQPETIDYLVKNNIRFCFVFPDKQMKQELVRRMEQRGTPYQTIKNDDDKFYDYYVSNHLENKSVLHYEFGKNEYLEDILKKFNFDFNKHKKNNAELNF